MSAHFMKAAIVLALAGSAHGGLVNRYTFDNPVPGDPTREADMGSNNTAINLFNGASRVNDGAVIGSTYALQSGVVAGGVNDDPKIGVFFPSGSTPPNASTLTATANTTAISIMGWFKPTADLSSGTHSMMGLLIGDSGIAPNAHNGRALFEISNNRIIALGRRIDSSSMRPVVTTTLTLDEILPQNEWSFIAATFDYDLGQIRLYRNGSLLATDTPSYAPWALTAGVDRVSNSPSVGIKIGGQVDDDTTPFIGLIDEVRIYNELLPATGANSIQSIYTSMVPEPGALALVGLAALPLARNRRTKH